MGGAILLALTKRQSWREAAVLVKYENGEGEDNIN
jgi:hypothetical protein